MTIRQKQALLSYFGCYDGIIDGVWGLQSQAGTRRLQEKLGISVDGIFGNLTEQAARKAVAERTVPEEISGDFWAGIRYWTREEFRCRCREYYPEPLCSGFPVEPDQTLVQLADDIRERAGAPAHRTSGIRCPEHNLRSGGVASSRHLSGKALDFFVEGVSGETLLDLVLADRRASYAYRIRDAQGRLTDCIHMDVE